METRSFKKIEKESDDFFKKHKSRFDSIEENVNTVIKNQRDGGSDLRTSNFHNFYLSITCQRDISELRFFKCYKKFYERWLQIYKTTRSTESALMLRRLVMARKFFGSRNFFVGNADLCAMILSEPL